MFDDEDLTFEVVANHEEQYSIWPEFKEIPDGWIAVGPKGQKDECLDYIEVIWTDMRPKSLRDKMRDRDDVDESEPDPDEIGSELLEAAESVVDDHADRVGEYESGKPELFGWFVARVYDSLDDTDDIDPEMIRAALRAKLPAHEIPDNYA